MARNFAELADISDLQMDQDTSYENYTMVEKRALESFVSHSFEITIEIVACDFAVRVFSYLPELRKVHHLSAQGKNRRKRVSDHKTVFRL